PHEPVRAALDELRFHARARDSREGTSATKLGDAGAQERSGDDPDHVAQQLARAGYGKVLGWIRRAGRDRRPEEPETRDLQGNPALALRAERRDPRHLPYLYG